MVMSRNRNGIYLAIPNRDWDSTQGMHWAIGCTSIPMALGVVVAIVVGLPFAVAVWVVAGIVGFAMIGSSLKAKRRRTEIYVNAFGLTIETTRGFSKPAVRNLNWAAVRYVDPYIEDTSIEGFNSFGVKLLCYDGEEIEVLPLRSTNEQAMFIAYHLQRQQQTNTKSRQKDPKTIWRKRRKLLQRTIVDSPARSTAPADRASGELACSRCGAPISKSDISASVEAAVCKYCGAIEDLRETVPEYLGDQTLEFPSAYTFKKDRRGIRISKGESTATKVAREVSFKALPLWFLVIGGFAGIPGYTAAAILGGGYRYWLVSFFLAAVCLATVVWFAILQRRVLAESLLISPRGIVFREFRGKWQATSKVSRSRLRNIYAQADPSDTTEVAHVVFELNRGQSMVSFDMPTPWHAQFIVRQSKALMKM